jgi:alkaline phosphatase D
MPRFAESRRSARSDRVRIGLLGTAKPPQHPLKLPTILVLIGSLLGFQQEDETVPGVEIPVALELTHGPFLGHLDTTEANLWMRASLPGKYTVSARPMFDSLAKPIVVTQEASAASDLTLSFQLAGLEPGTSYDCLITCGKTTLAYRRVRTPFLGTSKTRIIFGSCADERRFPDHGVWDAILQRDPEALVLLGDTPYIDSTDLEHQRRRYREFMEVDALATLLASTPTYNTWDDHDFGRNDTNGLLKGRENSRQAFIEYHAGPQFGLDGEGIFTSFRRGPVEVFLIDARWFAFRDDSVAAPGSKTLVGAAQWKWLTDGLEASEAPFKVLASGMIWNEATRPGKPDHWGSYAAERDALFRFIGDKQITGVVLVGGDIHRSRVVEHLTTESAGYPLTELISSPMANTIIETANAPHPGLKWDAGLMHTFLELDVDAVGERQQLVARFRTQDGKVHHEVVLQTTDLGVVRAPAELPK